MGKKFRVKQRNPRDTPHDGAAAIPPRQPCPCGSGRRYKHCHGRSQGPPSHYVARTFHGLPNECDWVALREIVPAATAPLALRDAVSRGREVTICSLLPLALPAVVRDDGSVWLGLQVHANHGDVSRDLAHALELALSAEPGSRITLPGPPPEGPRMQDLVAADTALAVTVHEGFDFWIADAADPDGQLAAALQTANDAASPTQRLASVAAAYWTRMGEREFVRWVLPYEEAALLDALARLHAAGDDLVVEPSRLLGTFRAHGLLTPVWEVPRGTGGDALEQPMTALSERLDAALADDSPLGSEQRSARNGLATRQLTLR